MTEQVKINDHVEAKTKEILAYFDAGLTWNEDWLREQLHDLASAVAKEFRPEPAPVKIQTRNSQTALDWQARRAKMTERERFEYDYPDFEG